MAEIWFYHLQGRGVETVLPQLLGKSLERGWRALMRATSAERLAALDDALWTFSDDSFLPHGTEEEGDPAGQPILLTTREANPNGAQILLLVDGARLPADTTSFERVVLVFDGDDETALAAAREDWRAAKSGGHEASYWQMDESGRWTKKA